MVYFGNLTEIINKAHSILWYDVLMVMNYVAKYDKETLRYQHISLIICVIYLYILKTFAFISQAKNFFHFSKKILSAWEQTQATYTILLKLSWGYTIMC